MSDEILNNNYFIDNTKCMAKKNIKSIILEQCPNKKSCGDFCGKHKNYTQKGLKKIDELIFMLGVKGNNNIKDLNDKIIGIDINIEDDIICDTEKKVNKKLLTLDDYYMDKTFELYTDKSILKSATHYKLIKTKNIKIKNITKEQAKTNILHESKNKLINMFYMVDVARKNKDKLCMLQNKIKQYLKNKKIRLHGPGLLNRDLCNNETDFYSFDSLKDIQDKYFFSYKSSDGFIYGFHIESFVQLIDNNTVILNPYNREKIPKNVMLNAKKIWEDLEKGNCCSKEIKSIVTGDIKNRVKNKILTTFQKMDFYGYQTNIEWIYNSTLSRTKTLYKYLLNYWHFKAGFNDTMRVQIYPDEIDNPLFTDSLTRKVNRTINKYVVMDTIINIIDKLVSNGLTESDKQNGCIMTLMAINEINNDCGQSNPWLL